MRIPRVHAADRRAWRWALGVGSALALVAVAVGGLVGLAGPLIATAALATVAVAVWALTSLEVGLWGAIGLITLLPFASLPVKVVFTPTLLDLALGSVFLVYLLQWMTGRRSRLSVTPAHAPIVLFAALAVFSFAAGQPNGPLTTNLLRQFAELLLNILLALVVVDCVDSQAKLSRLVRVILIGGTAAAALGLVLYFVPDTLATRALSALRVVGYPAGDVLRYVEDNPEQPLRAISTSVDPNVLGGMLAMIGGLLAPQIVSRRPVLGSRWVSAGAFGLVVACLVLTYSRTAMAGLAAAFVLIAALRYRRLLWVMAAAGLIILVLPATAGYVQRFAEGLQGQDLATQMRLGEYKDAFILIARYPVLGVGFAGAPDIDVYLGVSSAYLLIAEQMGLVGLAAFVLSMGVVFAWAWQAWPEAQAETAGAGRASLWLGVHAGLLAALAVGLVDHYFFKLSFQSAGTLFWLYVGLALASTRLLHEPAAGLAPVGAARMRRGNWNGV
jgi:O-antigen ligase